MAVNLQERERHSGYDTANYNHHGFGATLVGIFFVSAVKKRG
jgi:hypothetical protein